MKTWEKVVGVILFVALLTVSIVGIKESDRAYQTTCQVLHNRELSRTYLAKDIYAPLPVPETGDLAVANAIIRENERRLRRYEKYQREFPVRSC